ncbi:ATP-binding cassette subfamily B protein [Mucilaginibacter yixingensis]|uniref:ATP-binding cassette subfamily B protein n=1 Tax=Mucilaginibacter yixingensis TaxID=1295612 RepID=A0A2T5J8M0_9SPHI|nr:ABC transporter ATP-binding protein [Mucilaginibacter yixingensis]PTQ95800.1 ATP-binding cassette subfamily B protein [Mucilaginibacter yixingensis]
MEKKPGILSLLKPYRGLVLLLLLFTLLGNGINLLLPKIIAKSIDAFGAGHYDMKPVAVEFCVAVVAIFLFTYLQSIIQTYASEKVARDLRTRLAGKISQQSHAFIEKANPAKLLTNLTADVDSIKMFVSQAIVSIVSSIFIIVGVSVLLLTINWALALCVIAIIPIIGITFFLVLRKVRALFVESRAVIDWLNRVINESIMGAALIRVVNSQTLEYNKFLDANTKAKGFGLQILKLFAGLIPVISFSANLATLTILVLGGHFVITGSMTMGNFAAFTSYLTMLIFPILIIGFMSNVIAQASASFGRITAILETPELTDPGTITAELQGKIDLKNITIKYGQKPVLKDVSISIKPGERTAIIGPTAAGKTQLLYLLTGLVKQNEGELCYDDHHIDEYHRESFYNQVGFVFQDSIIFNMSIRENIAFSDTVTDDSLSKAIHTAELHDFVENLPDKLNTIVSERGSSLSGGQKQRIMLARALAVNPRILLLDDFTARVDAGTEKKILQNIRQNYPGITLISITQKIAAVEDYDQIILLMEGEVIGHGKHPELMSTSPEYVQLYNSQQSTSNYELQS